MEWYLLIVAVHVLSAVVWLGGMLFLAVVAPELRRVEDPGLRARLFERLGVRFRTVGWICIVLLLATGIGQLQMRQWWGFVVWTRPGFWTSSVGTALAWKLVLAVTMVALQALHDFWLGPRASRAQPLSDGGRFLRKRAAHLARLNAFIGLVLVYVAVRLARGG